MDNEGTNPARWANLKGPLGPLLFQWKTGCLEDNILQFISDDAIEAFISDPEGERTGDRLRTLADRLGIADKSFNAVKTAAADLRVLIIEAALGRIPAGKIDMDDNDKKVLRSHQRCWFKSFSGGEELAAKMFYLGAWPSVKSQLLPFVNAVLAAEKLPQISDIQ